VKLIIPQRTTVNRSLESLASVMSHKWVLNTTATYREGPRNCQCNGDITPTDPKVPHKHLHHGSLVSVDRSVKNHS
jgi:hypothetical protein